MSTNCFGPFARALLCSAAVSSLLLGQAVAAGPKAATEAQRQYQKERAFCMSGQSQQDRATCMAEATNAYAEARRGTLGTTGSTDYQANALARCNVQPPEERPACIQLVQGQGQQSGSVTGGGVIREMNQVVK
ncbi:MAG: hypothetical protein ACKVOO_04885 [Burkholderiaceae bacterium]